MANPIKVLVETLFIRCILPVKSLVTRAIIIL